MNFLKAAYSYFTTPQRRRKEITMEQFTKILLQNFVYFSGLSAEEKTIFLNRLYAFRRSKNFHLVDQEPNLTIEVLVSAAAVQLSFGMKDSSFSYFDDIFVMKNAYTYGTSDVAWAGHVNSKGIYISWYHFSFGYQNNNDRYNVALHEMAHALEYEFQFGKLADDEHERKLFTAALEHVREIVTLAQVNSAVLFTNEGLQNVHECWAEAIELFFENPSELISYYPQLYTAIKSVLKQDPLNNIRRLINEDPGSN